METMMVAGMILTPTGLIICVLIPALAIFAARSRHLSAPRLVSGYLGALAALAIMVAVTSYVSPQEAEAVWHVPRENYWSAIFELFFGTFTALGFISIVGISFVGLPVLVMLYRYGKATAPWLILIAAAISTALAIIFCLSPSSSDEKITNIFIILVGGHMMLAAGFSLAARLPWALRSDARHADP